MKHFTSIFDGCIGEALYRFLLSQTIEPPSFVVQCRGTHLETRTRTVTHSGHHHSDSNSGHHNGPHTKIERYTENVVDFDFRIDLTHHLLSSVNWTVSDNEPAYRGKMVREKEVQDGFSLQRHSTTRKENKAAEKWRKFKEVNGYAPWVQAETLDEADPAPGSTVFRSSRTFRDWADEYCASEKLLKEFVFEKVVHGWNLGALEKSIETLIKSTYYTGDIKINFSVTKNKVYIRPTNDLSRALSHWWVKVLLWITLIYPFIWLFKRFAPNGGGVWRVSGAAYPLKQWVHLEDSIKGEDVSQYMMRKEESQQLERPTQALPTYTIDYKPPPATITSSAPQVDAWAEQRPHSLAQFGTSSSPPAQSSSPTNENTLNIARLRQTPRGISQLVGLREGEWFKQWETTISRCVILRLDRRDPLTLPSEILAGSAGALLDGYN